MFVCHVCPTAGQLSCLAKGSWPAILHGENFDVGHYAQTFQPKFFVPAMLEGTIDIYVVASILMTFTLAEEENVRAK